MKKWSRQPIDLTGQRSGSLLAIRRGDPHKRRVTWLCRCDCGGERVVLASHLRAGTVKSCGCGLSGRRRRNCAAPREKYLVENKRLYRIWQGMLNRCTRTTDVSYWLYGARGITVCEEWQEFRAFEAWSKAHGYADDLTIDRIDGKRGYSPDNCRWATFHEQSRNKSNNQWFEINGERMILMDACAKFQVSRQLVADRMKRGWPAHALFNPPGVRPMAVVALGS